MDGALITCRLQIQAWKVLVLTFDFLQQHHIGLGLAQPSHDIGQSGIDRIDVPGGNTHGNQAAKLLPQPQVAVALGFLT